MSAIDAYAASWNLCEVAGRLALGAARRPPFESDPALFARVAKHGETVDRLAVEHGFEEPAWGACGSRWPRRSSATRAARSSSSPCCTTCSDDVSLQRSAGDVWRLARLRAMLRMGRAGEGLAWDGAFTDQDPNSVPGVVHGEELAWERLMAATAHSPTARGAVYQYAAAIQRRWALGSALAADQLVARVAELAGERERQRLAAEAARDPLTDVLNRRGLIPCWRARPVRPRRPRTGCSWSTSIGSSRSTTR